MKERWLLIANFAIFAIAAIINANIQSVLWFQLFGAIAAPALWILPLVYFSVYRTTTEGIILTYLLTLLLCPMTITPFGIFLLVSLGVLLSCQSFKSRVYWDTPSYPSLISAIAVVLFNLYLFFASWIFESSISFRPDLLTWILQPAMTALLAPIFFHLFSAFDKWTHTPNLSEAEIETL